MQLTAPAMMDYLLNGRVAGPIGNWHPLGVAAPHGVFRSADADRWISIAVLTDAEWEGLIAAMGRPAWADAIEFSDAAARVRHIETLHERLAAWTVSADDYELAARLQARSVAAAPVLNVADLLADPHYRARGTFIEVLHPLGFQETIYGAYVKTSGWQPEIRPGPMLGQDNAHVFKEVLGMPDDRYQQLINDQVIY